MTMIPISSLLFEPPQRRDPPPPRRSATFERKLQAQEAVREAEQQRASQSQQKAQARQARQMLPRHLPVAERELRQLALAADRHSAGPEPAVVEAVDGRGRGGGGGGGANEDHRGSAGRADLPGAGADGDIECEMLMDLLPGRAGSGIFELLLPSGDTLAVVADVGDRQACFLLTPSSERLRAVLNRQRTELEGGLTQRMNKYVRLTVL